MAFNCNIDFELQIFYWVRLLVPEISKYKFFLNLNGCL